MAQLGVNYLYTPPHVLYHPENNHVESYFLVRMSVLCIACGKYSTSLHKERRISKRTRKQVVSFRSPLNEIAIVKPVSAVGRKLILLTAALERVGYGQVPRYKFW